MACLSDDHSLTGVHWSTTCWLPIPYIDSWIAATEKEPRGVAIGPPKVATPRLVPKSFASKTCKYMGGYRHRSKFKDVQYLGTSEGALENLRGE
jgi:hypothetical protein